jgi:hypothetical protein
MDSTDRDDITTLLALGATLSLYQKEKMKRGVHPWQVHARNMLNAWNIPIPDGAEVLSLFQKKLMKREKHNFQKHARKMLGMMGLRYRLVATFSASIRRSFWRWEYILGRCTPGLSLWRWMKRLRTMPTS